MPTLSDLLRTGYKPPTASPMGDPIVEHFRTLPQQIETNQRAMDKTMSGIYKTDFMGKPNPNYYPEAMGEFTQMMPIAGTVGKALPRKELIEKQITALEDTGRAKVGGQIADSNGFFYKGGQFLPTTQAEPGKWKINGKWIKSGDVLIEPGKVATQPTPFSKSIYSGIKEFIEPDKSGKYKIKEGLKALGNADEEGMRYYEDVTGNTTWTPTVNNVAHKEPIDLKTLVDAFNNGQRWFDVNPDAITKTTK